MPPLIPRHLKAHATEVLNAFPAVVIQGARQVGKSTFAQILVEERDARVITLDDPASLDAATADPTGFVNQLPKGTLVIDEIQRAPELILPIKASIDRDRTPGRFLLTGSSDLLRLPRTPDSLAGRAVTVNLRGFSQGELRGRRDDLVGLLRSGADPARFRAAATREEYAAVIARGGYPDVQALSSRLRSSWLDSYIERLMQRDVGDIAPRVDSARVASVLRLMAANQAGELVKARIARDAAVPETSVTTYLDLLATMYLIDSLRPWTPNLTGREASKPKTVVTDPGLALRLSRVGEQQLLPLTNPFLGAAIEGFVVTELMKQQSWSAQEFELFHYRDRDGIEVDIMVEFFDGSVIGLEVKSGSTLKTDHFTGLKILRDRLGDRFLGGYVLNTAPEGMRFGERLWGIPIATLWEA